MAAIKSYSDLQQSKKLAEILPLESADGFWEYHDKWCSEGDEWEGYENYPRAEPYLEYTRKENEWKEDKSDVPCWSLPALLNILHCTENDIVSLSYGGYKDGKYISEYVLDYEYKDGNYMKTFSDNPVDVCYEMILKLHELKVL